MTLAAELNPHKTELNPHKAVETASQPRRNRSDGPSELGQSPPAWQLAKELSRRPAVRCARDAPLPPRAEVAHA